MGSAVRLRANAANPATLSVVSPRVRGAPGTARRAGPPACDHWAQNGARRVHPTRGRRSADGGGPGTSRHLPVAATRNAAAVLHTAACRSDAHVGAVVG